MGAVGKGQNHGIHLVRGLCALGVAGYHYLSWEHGIAIESAGAFLVYVFFVISALTLMMVHSSEFAREIALASALDFYARRVARILPLLGGVALFAAVSGSVMAGSWQVGTFARAYLTGTTLFGLQTPGIISNVVAAWSLGIEAVFYLVFPIIALMARNVRFRTVVVATVLLIVAQQAAILLIRGEKSPTFWFYYANPLVFSPFFALGLLIFFKPLKVNAANFWLSMLALASIVAFSVITPIDVYRNPIVYLFLTALTGFAVLTAYSSTVPEQISKLGRFLGDISYALYLTHWFSYRLSDSIASRLRLEGIQPILFVGIAVVASYLIFKYLEIPARDFLRRKLGVEKRSATPDEISVASTH